MISLDMTHFKYPYKKENGYPKAEQAEFLNLAFTRYIHLVFALQTPKEPLTPEQRFYYLKELISIYNELEVYPIIKNTLLSIEPINPVSKFGPIFKTIRNLLAHFPFFYSWDEVKFNKDLVTCMSTKNSSINTYFSSNDHPQFFFRFINQKTGNISEGKIISPKGYINNETIYLRDILSIDDGVKLIIGYSHLVLSSCMEGNDLEFYNRI